MTLRLDRLESFLRALPDLTIGLVGDLFLDRYLELEADVFERSIETGLEAYQVAHVRNCPVALGTVLNNLAALGVRRLRPVTVLGDDGHGYDLRRALQHLPVDLETVLMDPQRLTPTYTKPLRTTGPGHWEELNRLDVRTRGPLSRQITTRVCEALREVFAACAGVIVLDQVNERDWGVVNEQVRGFLGELAHNDPGKLVFVDSRTRLRDFHFGVLKGNRREILEAGAVSDDRPDGGGGGGCLARPAHRPARLLHSGRRGNARREARGSGPADSRLCGLRSHRHRRRGGRGFQRNRRLTAGRRQCGRGSGRRQPGRFDHRAAIRDDRHRITRPDARAMARSLRGLSCNASWTFRGSRRSVVRTCSWPPCRPEQATVNDAVATATK